MSHRHAGRASCLVVLITAGSVAEARRLARRVVDSHLAACVNIVPRVESFFRWRGRLDRSAEALLIVKTTSARLSALIKGVRGWHSYESPEIIALPIVGGDDAYLRWVRASCAVR